MNFALISLTLRCATLKLHRCRCFANCLPKETSPGCLWALLFFEQSLGVKPEGGLQSVFSHFPPGLPGLFRGAGCHSVGEHAGLRRPISSKEAERGTEVWCLTVTRLPRILEQHRLSSPVLPLVLLLWKTARPLLRHWETQTLPLSAKKFFRLQSSLVL